LREFSRRLPAGEEWPEAGDDIRNVHDRAAAIILGAHVEMYLQRLLLAHLPNAKPEIFLPPSGPLTDFYAKNHLAFAMGIIPKAILKDLEVVRRVRNAFAHAPAPMRFSDPPIRDECRKMRFHPIHFKEITEKYPEELLKNEKELFCDSAAQVIIDLTSLLTLQEVLEKKKQQHSVEKSREVDSVGRLLLRLSD
jgi:DNA-binding MltR family transcriptional regulator